MRQAKKPRAHRAPDLAAKAAFDGRQCRRLSADLDQQILGVDLRSGMDMQRDDLSALLGIETRLHLHCLGRQ